MEFLLELNTEEMPPAHVAAGLEQLEQGLKAGLETKELVDSKGTPGRIETFGTCRRLIVYGDLVPRQKDKEIEIVGPPKAAAFTSEGKPAPAAFGFAKSQGVEVQDLDVMETEKGEYVGIRRTQTGRPAADILPDILAGIITKLSFPKMMRWGSEGFRFSRPIKNILCLFDGKPLRFEVAGKVSVGFTYGHALFSPRKLKVTSFRDYREQLRKHKVIIDYEARKQRIERQMSRRLEPFEATCHPDPELLDKLSMDVEYPYVIMGTFPEEYLKLPLDVLSTAMKKGQNLFSVVKGRKQLPIFLGVSDACDDAKGLVKKGNERVLIARLEDARFFWQQDLNTPLKTRADDLARVIFQEKLGSYEEKSERLQKTTAYLIDRLESRNEKKAAVEAAGLCKVDLMTEMVREFPSLQGRAGGLYARKEGYSASVWKAIYEHYSPVNLEDQSPTSLTGAVLSICDKLDSVIGTLGTGVEFSSSKDPYGLRRNAQGVCMVILDRKLNFSFPRLLDKVISVYEGKLDLEKEVLKRTCLEFFRNRLQHIFERQGYRYDLVNAVMALGMDNIYHNYLRLKALDGFKDSIQFEPMILIAKRVNNILKGQPRFKINPDLLCEKEERELHTTFEILHDNVQPLVAKGDFAKAQRMVFRIRTTINSFFDCVLVMDENIKLQRNRLALLQAISLLLSQIADYSQIVIPAND
jgi:glycyl-tRNA synthetase beta chain